jgi:hypothetical protein
MNKIYLIVYAIVTILIQASTSINFNCNVEFILAISINEEDNKITFINNSNISSDMIFIKYDKYQNKLDLLANNNLDSYLSEIIIYPKLIKKGKHLQCLITPLFG